MSTQARVLQARLIHSGDEPVLDILGPKVQFLVDPADASGAFGLIRGIIEPGVAVPLHSHRDPEVLVITEGSMQFLQYEGHASRWVAAGPGEVITIPGGVKHALLNSSQSLATVFLLTTPQIHGFFRELARPVHPERQVTPPTAEDMERILALSAEYDYWIASPEENAAVGLVGF